MAGGVRRRERSRTCSSGRWGLVVVVEWNGKFRCRSKMKLGNGMGEFR